MTTAEVERLESRLRNWARWATSGSGGVGHCGSAEHRYVPPRPDEEAFAARARMPVDVTDAELVDSAVAALPCALSRQFLQFHYEERMPRNVICRKLRLGMDLFDGFRRRAMAMLHGQIEEREYHARLIRKGKPLWAGGTRIP